MDKPTAQRSVETSTAPSSLNWIYPVVSVAALIIFGVGLYLVLVDPKNNWTMLAAGCVSLIAVGVTWPIAYALAASRSDLREDRQISSRIHDRLEQMTTLVGRVSESQLLSDRAKSVAFREKDRDAIRRAIHEEMGRGEWEAAFALADQFEQAFGSKSEADRFRGEINHKRSEDTQKQIAEVVAVIDRHTRNEQWTAAVREAETLHTRFPNDDRVRNLPADIEQRRQSHKKQLLQSWHEAVARHDTDGSIEILKQLDSYLTPAEAESMQDTARGVFKEKLNNLVAQFSGAIREHKWAEAVRTGEQIQSEFPNSRAAQEVKEKMDMLRQRASEPAAASA
ncbi:MAG TPA: hypothetical protein VLJ39_09780 [Tepidisphaeraceae bacterium]|nr:hypothetical protein [Tepidisphaeraceae bacterium]